MLTKRVNVICTVEVTVDESKFNEKFMQEFRESFFPFRRVHEHITHLAQLHVRGIACDNAFIEGYGYPSEMGISFQDKEIEMEIIGDKAHG